MSETKKALTGAATPVRVGGKWQTPYLLYPIAHNTTKTSNRQAEMGVGGFD